MTVTSVRKTFKYQLMPTPAQAQALETVLSRCRTLYNIALEQRKTWWQRGQGKSATYYQQATELPDLKTACPDYTEVNAQVLQDALRRLDKTFAAFFRRVQHGETPGYPRFQGENRYHSFTYPQYGNGAVLDGSLLSLSKIGRIPIRVHRPLHGMPKTVTVSKEAGGWYACFSCAEAPVQPLPFTGKETGIDVGLNVFLMTADGVFVENPRHYRKAERDLKKAQRRVSRRKKGSHRRKKAVKLLARKHQKVQRQRRDFHHKTALALVRQYDVIYLEELRVRNLVRNHRLAKSISDAGWAQFRTTLEYKAACAGKQVIAIEPAYTSQNCSGVLADGTHCPERIEKSLSVRTHICPQCGLVLDRDENAARNILRAGQARQGAVAVATAVN
ncbi:MAG: Mobile element protein [Ktedonobacterales bacterium]|nr:MAG: Mobile element protein [Ktedonobacterales bacterium]